MDIIELTKHLMKIDSTTHTAKEKSIESELNRLLSNMPYFKEHPDQHGIYDLPNDPFGRGIVYALIKGSEDKTLILLNHHDAVSVENYEQMKTIAFDADKLEEVLKDHTLNFEQREDLESAEWLWGRGSCDMKAGCAAELSYMTEYAKKQRTVNLLFISVPDEETYSDGMRAIQPLWQKLSRTYHLDYRFIINMEPSHSDGKNYRCSCGSIGKALCLITVKGISTHISAIEKAVNPIALLQEIIHDIECRSDFMQIENGEKTTPPVFNYLRDHKEGYDYSVAPSASAAFSYMYFHGDLKTLIAKLKNKIEISVQRYLKNQKENMNTVGRKFAVDHIRIISSTELTDQLFKTDLKMDGDFLNKGAKIHQRMIEQNFPDEAVVMISFIPPFYPPISSWQINHELTEKMTKGFDAVCQKHGFKLEAETYFQGVSDGSYCQKIAENDAAFLLHDPKDYNLPLDGYTIPLILIGPWGKELHQKTERVNRHTLVIMCPEFIETAITVLENDV